MLRTFVIIFFTCSLKTFYSQNIKTTFYENGIAFDNFFVKDSFELEKKTAKQKQLFIAKGYYLCQVDTVIISKSLNEVFFSKNKKFTWVSLSPDDEFLSFTTNKDKLNHLSIIKLFEKKLIEYENNGYPFAEIKIDSIRIVNDTNLYGKINITRNQFYKIDSIVIKGKTKTDHHIIYNILDIKPNMVYDESKIRSVKSKLAQCSFLSHIRDPEVSFTPEGKCLLTLFINDNNSNQFDGIAGINPDENTGKIVLTGDLKLKLNNVFRHAEIISLNWMKTKTNTQNFDAAISLPYLFKTKFGIDANIENYREDTNFSRLTSKIGFNYASTVNQKLGVYFSSISSNPLSQENTSAIFPEYNSSRVTLYGISFSQNTLNRFINPSKGVLFTVSTDIGNKRLRLNSDINNIDYTQLKENSSFYQLKGMLNWFIPIKNKSTFLLGYKGGAIFNEQIFENELYQIGGLNTLRGFNEQSLAVSSYSIFTIEYRFLIDRLSSFFVFADGAYTEVNTQAFSTDTPYGFGAGINIGSNAGVFSLAYGLGSQQNNPILIKNGKIHFGYTSTF